LSANNPVRCSCPPARRERRSLKLVPEDGGCRCQGERRRSSTKTLQREQMMAPIAERHCRLSRGHSLLSQWPVGGPWSAQWPSRSTCCWAMRETNSFTTRCYSRTQDRLAQRRRRRSFLAMLLLPIPGPFSAVLPRDGWKRRPGTAPRRSARILPALLLERANGLREDPGFHCGCFRARAEKPVTSWRCPPAQPGG
jgi:hypothetical protein